MAISPTDSEIAAPQAASWRDFVTLGNAIFCLIFLSLTAFVLLEFVIPEVRDRTAFWDAPPYVVANDPIKQPSRLEPFSIKGKYGLYTHKRQYQLEPVSAYVIEARVLHRRHYYSDANAADLIPFDLGLGWGPMADAAALRRYFIFRHINTGGRMLWITPRTRDIPADYVQEAQSGVHFSNNHIIPASDAIFETIRGLSAGDVVRLKGLLVNVTRPDAPEWRWITSQHPREDANKNGRWGDGASFDNQTTCDTMLVTEAEIIAQ